MSGVREHKRRNAGVSVNYTTREERAGTHNRKARRAAKAEPPKPTADPALEHANWKRHYDRRRAERNAYWASKTDADLEDMRLAESGNVKWDPLFQGLLFEAIPLWVYRHYRTDPDERVRRAHWLGENVLACSQAIAAICDPDARGTEEKGGLAEAFNALAEGLAIGAYCPGGATFLGINWAASGSQLRITDRAVCSVFSLHDESVWTESAP